jgi:hypothetical protein
MRIPRLAVVLLVIAAGLALPAAAAALWARGQEPAPPTCGSFSLPAGAGAGADAQRSARAELCFVRAARACRPSGLSMTVGTVDTGAYRSDLWVGAARGGACTIVVRAEHIGPWNFSWAPWSVSHATGTSLRWRGDGWALDGPDGPVAFIPWPLPTTSTAPDPAVER